jgi:predicted helicase
MQFDEVKHEYEVEGRRMLSVTKVLPDIPEYLLYKQTFVEKTLLGSRVHNCCDTINQHYMVHNSIPEEDIYWGATSLEKDRPYLDAYIKFLKECRPQIHHSEMKDFHKVYKYAGTIDLVAYLLGNEHVCDIKTSTGIAPYARLQLVAYMKMWNSNYPEHKVFKRTIIHLLPSADYKLITYPAKGISADFDIFLCKLKSAQWDAENGCGERF